MEFIQAIINFIKRLLGMGGDEPALASGASSGTTASGASPGADEDDDDDFDPSRAAREEWQELQQFVARFESGGEDMVGISWQEPVGWWKKQFGWEEMQGNGQDADEALRDLGFRDRDHFDRVGHYVAAKWSYLGKNDDGEDQVLLKDEYQNAALQARSGQVQQMQASALAADPSLLEPVDGVSVDQWANAAASLMQLGEGATVGQVNETLAKIGITKAQYDRANTGWQAKMQGDTTFVIATKYGEAFTKVQQGVAAAAGRAGADGGEPCSFDHFVEVMVAQGCWAEQGLDVSKQLTKSFGIDIGEYSRLSAYWSPKMGSDVALSREYTKLEARFKQKYQGSGLDDDLSL